LSHVDNELFFRAGTPQLRSLLQELVDWHIALLVFDCYLIEEVGLGGRLGLGLELECTSLLSLHVDFLRVRFIGGLTRFEHKHFSLCY